MQFLGSMNDNVFKVGFTSLVMFQAARFSGVDPATAAFLISAIFIVPFGLFSATSGQVPDKYGKAVLARLVKTFEIVVMLIGGAGFLLHSAPLRYACTFLMGVHSTVFGPVKYAYLPQHLDSRARRRQRSGRNGHVRRDFDRHEIIGGAAAGASDLGAILLAAACLGFALIGRVVSAFIPKSDTSQPDLRINWNPFSETWRNLRLAKSDRTVFSEPARHFVAVVRRRDLLLTSFFNFAKDVLSANPDIVTILLATFSIGIGTGSLLCEKLSKKRVEIGLVPLGSIGISVFAVDLFFASHRIAPAGHLLDVSEFLMALPHWRVLADLFLLSMFGGFYSVPLYALIQAHSQPTHRVHQAANNILNSFFMIASSLLAIALTSTGVGIPGLFLTTALLNVVVAIYIYLLMPEFLLRFIAWMLV